MTPQELVERALAASRADQCVVIADEATDANLRWAGNTLTTNGVSRSRALTVIALQHRPDGISAGVVSRSGIRDEQLPDLLRAAEQAAAESSPAEDARPLIDATPGPFGRWDDPVPETDISVFRDVAPALGEAFGAADAAGRKLYGYAEHELGCSFLGTSTGLRLRHDQPTGKLQINAKSADMERSTWAGTATRDFHDVDVAGLYAQLGQQLEWAKRRVELPAGRYETLLTPSAVADLFIYLYWSAGARDALDGRSVFSKPGGGTKVGEQLSALPVRLRSDPSAAGLECSPFVTAHASSRDSSVFDNGLALRSTDWISGGSLTALTQTRHSAELTGLNVTPAIDNLIFEVEHGPSGRGPDEAPPVGGAGTSAGSLYDMIAETRRGLLVNCLWYIREVDPQTLLLTGLTRDGVYLVENGEVTGAVNNFRFNESPVAILGRLSEAGQTVPALPREWGDYFTRAAMPPLRIEGFNMSSVSQAS
jgi:predicted Zn-dependent protease